MIRPSLLIKNASMQVQSHMKVKWCEDGVREGGLWWGLDGMEGWWEGEGKRVVREKQEQGIWRWWEKGKGVGDKNKVERGTVGRGNGNRVGGGNEIVWTNRVGRGDSKRVDWNRVNSIGEVDEADKNGEVDRKMRWEEMCTPLFICRYSPFCEDSDLTEVGGHTRAPKNFPPDNKS